MTADPFACIPNSGDDAYAGTVLETARQRRAHIRSIVDAANPHRKDGAAMTPETDPQEQYLDPAFGGCEHLRDSRTCEDCAAEADAETGTAPRIRWIEDTALRVWSGYGHAGEQGAQLFTIAAPLPGSDSGYLLMSRLTGMEDFACSRPRLEEAQAEAETWLSEFIASLGAVWPEPPKEGQ